MDIEHATRAMGALAQASRLKAFRMLVEAGPDGMSAGDIARTLEVPHNTMSSHLAILERAGLVGFRREGRSVIYAADYDGIRRLLSFLMEDCCQGSPEVCSPVLDRLMAACCAAPDEACAPETLPAEAGGDPGAISPATRRPR